MSAIAGFKRSVFGVVTLAAVACAAPASASDALLSGKVLGPDRKPMGGVAISAKAEGATIATTVFTGEDGVYVFPAMPASAYRIRAQALTFGMAEARVAADGKKKQDFNLVPLKDFVRQLPSNELLAALPRDTPEDAAMHRILRSQCSACHSTSYVLQHKFDEEGWDKILNLMKTVNVYGVKVDRHPQAVIDFNQKQLAAYLARARGPGPTSMKFDHMRPRPSGEAARVVFREYDAPVNSEAGLTPNSPTNDGSDWTLGTPSAIGSMVHDAWLDLNGDLWYTSNTRNRELTVGRINGATGELKKFRIVDEEGYAARTHGMTRDPAGNLWFNVMMSKRGGLGRMDPRTEKLDVFMPPDAMMPTGGAVTVDYDGKGDIWCSAPQGALRFDPKTERFTEFKSRTFKTPNGYGFTYGTAGDRDGNGWWAEMVLDTLVHGDAATGEVTETKLPPIKEERDRVSPAAMEVYDKALAPDFNSPFPWQQGPRRMGSDKAADVLWVGDSWGGNIARVNTRTSEITYVPLPFPKTMESYHINVDSQHRVWANFWMTDQFGRYDPATRQWTVFDLPTRGTEARFISTLEDGNGLRVVVPYARANKIAVMTFRGEAELAAARAAAN